MFHAASSQRVAITYACIDESDDISVCTKSNPGSRNKANAKLTPTLTTSRAELYHINNNEGATKFHNSTVELINKSSGKVDNDNHTYVTDCEQEHHEINQHNDEHDTFFLREPTYCCFIGIASSIPVIPAPLCALIFHSSFYFVFH